MNNTSSIKPEFTTMVENNIKETPIEEIKNQVEEANALMEDAAEKSEEAAAITEEIKEEVINLEKKPKAEAKKKTLPKKKSLPKKPKVEAKATEKVSAKKTKAIKDTVKAQKMDILEKVVSNREVKWIYPEDVQDTLARKSWRQKQRNAIHKLERDLFRIEDQNSKEYKAALKKLNAKKAEVLKPGMEIG